MGESEDLVEGPEAWLAAHRERLVDRVMGLLFDDEEEGVGDGDA